MSHVLQIDANPGCAVTPRDLAAESMPYLDDIAAPATVVAGADRTPEQFATLRVTTELAEEIAACDSVLVRRGHYNFGRSGTLKAWFSRIASPVKTVGALAAARNS
jgi:FMN-dependent NADH-azoreductase